MWTFENGDKMKFPFLGALREPWIKPGSKRLILIWSGIVLAPVQAVFSTLPSLLHPFTLLNPQPGESYLTARRPCSQHFWRSAATTTEVSNKAVKCSLKYTFRLLHFKSDSDWGPRLNLKWVLYFPWFSLWMYCYRFHTIYFPK